MRVRMYMRRAALGKELRCLDAIGDHHALVPRNSLDAVHSASAATALTAVVRLHKKSVSR
jgi:hypothetical protein